MGYTHYWTPKKVSFGTWLDFLKKAKKLKDNLPQFSENAGGYYATKDADTKLCGWDGTGAPIFSIDRICFNGDAEYEVDHETFLIGPEETEWNFCKTARKPYDLMVCAMLLLAHNELGYEISSDGDYDDWKHSIDFYIDTFYGRSHVGREDAENMILPDCLKK